MKSLILLSLLYGTQLFSNALTLQDAIELIKNNNLEVKVATLDEKISHIDSDILTSKNFGVLEFMQDYANSNDAGNVFGFKLSSREATFGDFGAEEFMNAVGANGGIPPQSAYTTPPNNLNYPTAQNYFKSKLSYEVPLYTGGKLSSYQKITHAVSKIKQLDKTAMINEKLYQTKKSFYDMALLQNSLQKITTLEANIVMLKEITKNMIDEGYAKKIDLLEVESKEANIVRIKNQLHSNEKLLYQFLSFLLNRKVNSIEVPQSDIVYQHKSTNLENSIDIQKAKAGLEIFTQKKEVANSSYFPVIGARAEVATADDTFLGDAVDHASYTVGAQLKWNLFNGGADSANSEKSQVEYLKMKTQLELAKAGISLQVQKIKTEMQSFQYETESLSKELVLQNEILQNYQGRYKEKLVSMSDVIIKHSELLATVLELLSVKNSLNERVIALEKILTPQYK
jgi:outer membrane protein TolC